MPTLSKSKIIAFRQCPKRMWLDVHRPDLREVSTASEARFKVGHQVGDLARQIYDPDGEGVFIDIKQGFREAFELSAKLLAEGTQTIFEAGFRHSNTIALADVMIPTTTRSGQSWKMVEVKSSGGFKAYHLEDIAVQVFLARGMGLDVSSVALGHVDTSWTYPGGGDYRGFLKEHDLTQETLALAGDVRTWLSEAHQVANMTLEPEIETGPQCGTPFECPFSAYCNRENTPPTFPVDWLPRLTQKQRTSLDDVGIVELSEVPEGMLTPKQKRVREHTIQNTQYFDSDGAKEALQGCGFPAYFLDFETANLTVPIWAGTRPFQQIPFQFSLHKVAEDLSLQHEGFLEISGDDPSRLFAEAVIKACRFDGPVFVYNATFEKMILRKLSHQFSDLSTSLQRLVDRIVDLLPVAQSHFYAPSQCGSWSIKSVLPAAVPELSYDQLEGVRNGEMAVDAFAEAISPDVLQWRKDEIRKQLWEYCKLDTLAMVRLWEFFLQLDLPDSVSTQE